MTNTDFIRLLRDCPSTDQEEIFNEAAHRIQELETQIRVLQTAPVSGCIIEIDGEEPSTQHDA